MSSWYLIAIVLGAVVVVVTFVWHILPIRMMRKHKFESTKERLNSENSHRITLGAAIASAGFILPIMVSAIQYVDTSRAQRRDSDRRFFRELAEQYSQAMTKVAMPGDDTDLKIQSIFDLERTAISAKETPEHFVLPLTRFLVPLIRDRALQERNLVSSDCNQSPPPALDKEMQDRRRNDALARRLAEAAIGTLGRLRNFTEFPIRLHSLYLDRMDIGAKAGNDSSKGSFVGADFSKSHFRRANLSNLFFEDASFRGSDFAVNGMPSFSPSIAAIIMDGGDAYEREIHYCWIADFRDSVLVKADFRDAKLSGSDFRGARLENAKLDGADISLANFCETDVTREQIRSAAPWEKNGSPRGKFSELNMAPCSDK